MHASIICQALAPIHTRTDLLINMYAYIIVARVRQVDQCLLLC